MSAPAPETVAASLGEQAPFAVAGATRHARSVTCAALAGVLFGLAAWRWHHPVELAVHAALFAVLVVVVVIDCEQHRIPDRISRPAMAAAGVLVAVAAIVTGDSRRALAAAVGAALFSGGLGVAHLCSPRGMGRGDVKLAVTLGAALGWSALTPLDAVSWVLAAFLLASAAGTATGVALLVHRRRNAPFPFGPMLIGGTAAVLLAGPTVIGP